MKKYLELVQTVLDEGSWQENRTGIRTLSIPGACVRFDLEQGFPAVTTKKLAFRAVIGELVGFLRGYTSAADFRALDCKVWDQNANENAAWLANPFREGHDHLGPVYGAQWRRWDAYKAIAVEDDRCMPKLRAAEAAGFQSLGGGIVDGRVHTLMHKSVDQLRECLETIERDPTSRRILYHGWNPAVLDEIALPACHILKQFLCNPVTREISMCVYMRSVDVGLGLPFNCAHEAAMLHFVARLTGYKPRWLTMMLGDTHIYENHLGMVREQLKREPLPLPQLVIADRVPRFEDTGRVQLEWLDHVEPSDFSLQGYSHHPALTAPMAV
jgi:thymidylate synthase